MKLNYGWAIIDSNSIIKTQYIPNIWRELHKKIYNNIRFIKYNYKTKDIKSFI